MNAHEAMLREIAREKAQTLGRSGKLLEAALDDLRDFERRGGRRDSPERERLLSRAAERLGHVFVQREAWGMRDPDYVCRFYAVPKEVVARVGIRTGA